MVRLYIAAALACLCAACTPGAADHGPPSATTPKDYGKPSPYGVGIPDSFVPDVSSDAEEPAADTSTGGATDASVPMCPNAFGIQVPCPG